MSDNKMSDEMILRYLVLLTHMNAGTPKWKECYEAWNRHANTMDNYAQAIKRIVKFRRKYKIKKTKKT